MLMIRIPVGRASELKPEANRKLRLMCNERSKNSRYDATNGTYRMPTIRPINSFNGPIHGNLAATRA